MVTRCYRSLEFAAEIVKPFEQQELHGTVTIRSEFKIPG
jgi:hypothetical protein